MPGWNNPLSGKAGGVLFGGGGKKVYPVASLPWGPKLATHGPRSHRWWYVHIGQLNPGGWRPRSSLQLVFSSLSSLQLAFFVFLPTTPKPHMGPVVTKGYIMVATISSDKGSDIPPTPPTVDLGKKWNRRKELRG